MDDIRVQVDKHIDAEEAAEANQIKDTRRNESGNDMAEYGSPHASGCRDSKHKKPYLPAGMPLTPLNASLSNICKETKGLNLIV